MTNEETKKFESIAAENAKAKADYRDKDAEVAKLQNKLATIEEKASSYKSMLVSVLDECHACGDDEPRECRLEDKIKDVLSRFGDLPETFKTDKGNRPYQTSHTDTSADPKDNDLQGRKHNALMTFFNCVGAELGFKMSGELPEERLLRYVMGKKYNGIVLYDMDAWQSTVERMTRDIITLNKSTVRPSDLEARVMIATHCDEIAADLDKAIKKHPSFPAKRAPALSIIMEELGEAAMARNDGKDDEYIQELLHVIVTALRAYHREQSK